MKKQNIGNIFGIISLLVLVAVTCASAVFMLPNAKKSDIRVLASYGCSTTCPSGKIHMTSCVGTESNCSAISQPDSCTDTYTCCTCTPTVPSSCTQCAGGTACDSCNSPTGANNFYCDCSTPGSCISTTKDICQFSNPVSCTGYNYSDWGNCAGSPGNQTRTVTSGVPAGCTGGIDPVLSQYCVATSLDGCASATNKDSCCYNAICVAGGSNDCAHSYPGAGCVAMTGCTASWNSSTQACDKSRNCVGSIIPCNAPNVTSRTSCTGTEISHTSACGSGGTGGCSNVGWCCGVDLPVDGVCTGAAFLSSPPTTATGCVKGTISGIGANTSNSFGDYPPSGWEWTCDGLNNGNSSGCFALKFCGTGYYASGTSCIPYAPCPCSQNPTHCGAYTQPADASTNCTENTSCFGNKSCNDGDSCTTDSCSASDTTQCVNTAMNCNDGNSCTTDSCSGGSCSNIPINCNDGNSCTTDSCSGGSCSHSPISCNDGNSCTTDSCSGGSCSNIPINCDDGNSCTTDSCSGGSCSNTSTASFASCTSGSCSAPFCGQSKGSVCAGGNACGSTTCAGGCSSFCASTDVGTPLVPTITYPIGSALAPVVKNLASDFILNWSAYNDSRADSLSVGVWDASGNGVIKDGLATSGTAINATSVLAALRPDVLYHWQILAKNSTCAVENSAWSSIGYFLINEAPAYISGNLTIKNTNDVLVNAEPGQKNQICDSQFANSRRVKFTVRSSDAGASSDVNDIKLRWNGTEFTRTSLINGVAIFDVTLPDNLNNGDAYPLFVYMSDAYSNTGWVQTERSLKIWDCKVPVSGSLYDGSFAAFDTISCAGGSSDFTTKVKSSMLYSLTFKGVAVDTDKIMNVTHPDYSSGGSSLQWGAQYRPIFSGVDGDNPVMRFPDKSDPCNLSLASFTLDNSARMEVDPYIASPALNIDFSAFLVQLPWYQAAGGGVIAKNDIIDNIPSTCMLPCKSNVSMNGTDAGNGLVAAQDINTGSGSYGETNQWSVNRNVINSNYSYKYFYNEYYVKLGQGKVYNVGTGGITLNQIVTDTGGTGVVLVNGVVNVTTPNIVPVGSFFMLIASDDINVDQSVSGMQGIFITDKSFTSTGLSDSKLVIDGSVYSKTTVRLTRGFTRGTFNNKNPAVLVNYRPDFIFSMPGKLTKILSGWKEGI